MKTERAIALLISLLTLAFVACGDEEAEPTPTPDPGLTPEDIPEQPGADDPTARPWQNPGSWYPTEPEAMRASVTALLDEVNTDAAPRPAAAILTPHASFKYSGHVQAEVYARVEIPDLVILLASDHYFTGEPLALWEEGPWLIPGAALPIDDALTAELKAEFPELVADREPFLNHPPEMQLPFLHQLNPDVRIAAIAFADDSRHHFDGFDPERVRALGQAIARVIKRHEDAGEHVLLATTTDFAHREPHDVVLEKNTRLAGFVEDLDIDGMYTYVTDNRISICGELPTSVMMATLLELGRDADDVEVIKTASSFEINGDADSVIGYPGVIVW